jgi:hypothetical protein
LGSFGTIGFVRREGLLEFRFRIRHAVHHEQERVYDKSLGSFRELQSGPANEATKMPGRRTWLRSARPLGFGRRHTLITHGANPFRKIHAIVGFDKAGFVSRGVLGFVSRGDSLRSAQPVGFGQRASLRPPELSKSSIRKSPFIIIVTGGALVPGFPLVEWSGH